MAEYRCRNIPLLFDHRNLLFAVIPLIYVSLQAKKIRNISGVFGTVLPFSAGSGSTASFPSVISSE